MLKYIATSAALAFVTLINPALAGSPAPQTHVDTQVKTESNQVLMADRNAVDAIYQSQMDNDVAPYSTCGITSLSMALRFFGNELTSNDLIARYNYTQAQTNTGMAALAQNFGVSSDVFFQASRSKLQSHIDAGHPVVLQTYFTGSGHIVMIVGYDDTGWIFHDPYGEWSGTHGVYASINGYGGPYYGKFAHYSYGEVENSEGVDNYQGVAFLKN